MITAPFSYHEAVNLLYPEAIEEYNEYLDPYYDLPTETVVAINPTLMHIEPEDGIVPIKRDAKWEFAFHVALSEENEIGMLEALQHLEQAECGMYDTCQVLYLDWLTMQAVC